MDHYRLYSPEQLALDKYFQEWVLAPNGRSNHDWKEFLESYPHKKQVVDDAIGMVHLTGLSLDEGANSAYLEGWEHIHKNASTATSARPFYYKAAAAVAALMIVAFAAYRFQFKNNETILYTTGYGETKKVTLDDGTSITLNASSTLRLNNSFNLKDRSVSVEGDAFFEVVHTSNNAPFIVYTGDGVEVHVLGTSFDVNSRNKTVKVYLQSGEIRLVKGAVEKTLSPGDQAYISGYDNTITLKRVTAETAEEGLAWLKNQYVMNDVPLSLVADNIKETFGKIVVPEDTSLLSKRVTAKVPANDLKVLIEVLSQALEIKIEEKDNHLYIRKAEIK